MSSPSNAFILAFSFFSSHIFRCCPFHLISPSLFFFLVLVNVTLNMSFLFARTVPSAHVASHAGYGSFCQVNIELLISSIWPDWSLSRCCQSDFSCRCVPSRQVRICVRPFWHLVHCTDKVSSQSNVRRRSYRIISVHFIEVCTQGKVPCRLSTWETRYFDKITVRFRNADLHNCFELHRWGLSSRSFFPCCLTYNVTSIFHYSSELSFPFGVLLTGFCSSNYNRQNALVCFPRVLPCLPPRYTRTITRCSSSYFSSLHVGW